MAVNIGILGGMGMAATVKFLDLYVKAMNRRGRTEDDHFPTTIVLTLPLADWGTEGSKDLASVRGQVEEGVRWLRDAGATVIAAPCNSIHEFRDAFALFHMTFIDIIAETLAMVPSGITIGVLCSQQTRRAGLYETSSHKVVYLADQSVVDEAIDSVINGRPIILDGAVTALLAQGCDLVILGCTELGCCPLVGSYPVIDSASCLATALARWVS